jgi:hypothetical protein
MGANTSQTVAAPAQVPGPLLKRLDEELYRAFQDKSDLDRLVRFYLSEVLSSIVPDGKLESVRYNLLVWVDNHGRWHDFLYGVRTERPLLRSLLAVCTQVENYLRGGPGGNNNPVATPGPVPPPLPPAPRCWPLLLPNGQPFVDRTTVRGLVGAMFAAGMPRVLRIRGTGQVGKTYCIPYLLQEIRLQRPADSVAVLDLSNRRGQADLPEGLVKDVLYFWNVTPQMPPVPTGQDSASRRITDLARLLPQSLSGAGNGWIVLDGLLSEHYGVLADFIEELATTAMNGKPIWLVLVGYSRSFSSALLENYCLSLELPPITAADVNNYFIALTACLNCAGHPSVGDIQYLVSEYSASQAPDDVSVEILRTGVPSLARQLAGL